MLSLIREALQRKLKSECWVLICYSVHLEELLSHHVQQMLFITLLLRLFSTSKYLVVLLLFPGSGQQHQAATNGACAEGVLSPEMF
jgi:hypothetical protein